MIGQMPGRRGIAGAALAFCFALAGPAGPALAVAPDFGDHGAQARCRYQSVDLAGWSGAMRLKRITVQPPTLFAVSGSTQVGWRVLVQRRYDSGTWKRVFASAIHKAPAKATTAAAFSPLGALINSPLFVSDGAGGFRSADYRVVLMFYWFGADGAAQRLERHRVLFYDTLRDGAYQWTDDRLCHHGWIFE